MIRGWWLLSVRQSTFLFLSSLLSLFIRPPSPSLLLIIYHQNNWWNYQHKVKKCLKCVLSTVPDWTGDNWINHTYYTILIIITVYQFCATSVHFPVHSLRKKGTIWALWSSYTESPEKIQIQLSLSQHGSAEWFVFFLNIPSKKMNCDFLIVWCRIPLTFFEVSSFKFHKYAILRS